MADVLPTVHETSTTEPIVTVHIGISDSRVPRERDKNRVYPCTATGGWFSCPVSSSSTTTTTTTAAPLAATPATLRASTLRRVRAIGDASDDRRRDGVGSCALSDGSRHNDNNENNESDDVAAPAAAAAAAAAAAKTVARGGEQEDSRSAAVASVEGENGTIVVAAAVENEPPVVSRLEPAASEDRVRSGESVCDVAVAAGVLVDDAACGVLSSDNCKLLKLTANESFDGHSGIVNDDSYDHDSSSSSSSSSSVFVDRGRSAGSRGPSGENGERNSECVNVDNETGSERENNGHQWHDNCRYDEYDFHEHDGFAFVDETDESERDFADRCGARCIGRPTTGNGVLLVGRRVCARCFSSNNSSNSVESGFAGVSVPDIGRNDKIRVTSVNYDYERSSCDFSASRAAEVVQEEAEVSIEDLVLRERKLAMQSETATRKEEITEMEINDGAVVARLGSPFKGQIRTAEDSLVGPCGKKRCADRYDSSESSDSGVAVSCGDCSSSGTSDITEPGSPCSTSSDEGLVIRGTAPSPLPSLLNKLAPTTPPSHSGTRPQWPWTPPLAATACSTYKRLKGEPEAGTLPKAGAADPTARSGTAGGVKQQTASGKGSHHHHESQGKITEYFKAQIKPQQTKLKKTSTEMSLLVAKSSPEFRRPPTVQRNKGGLAKYLGVVLPNGRTSHEREIRTMTIAPRTSAGKMDKKLCSKVLSGLPIPSEVLASIPGCKISSLRLTGEASPKPSGVSPPATPTASLMGEPMTIDFEDVSSVKPTVNENNNLTNGQEHPLTRLSSGLLDIRERKEENAEPRAADEDDEDEEEEEDSGSGLSKTPSSPILSAPTTIRFPARAPEKKGPRGTDSGICRWDKCEARFECSGALLEHLQAAHINSQQGGDNFVCHWQGCKVQGRTSCSRRWLERHVLSHGGNKPFRCIVDGCGSRFSSQTALERHVNSHFNQPETSSSSGRRSCESGGKLVRRNGKKLRYRRQPWSARLFDYIDTGVMEGLQHRLVELAKTRTQGRLAETPGNSMALTSQVLARRVELDGKAKVLLRWFPRDIAPDEWVSESEVQSTKHIGIRHAATKSIDEVSLVLYPAVNGGTPPQTRTKQRRKPVKNS